MSTEIEIRNKHKEAMFIAQKALLAEQDNNIDESFSLYTQAFELEREVAFSLLPFQDREPTRSVLFRSAGELAKKCKQYREAEKMVAYGLTGNPPEEIANELRTLYEEITFFNALDNNLIELDSNQVELTLSGDMVGYGIVRSDEFISRFKVIEQMTYRTVERKTGKDYRKSGGAEGYMKEKFEPFLAVPTAGSFKVKIQLGKPSKQYPLFEDYTVQDVIDEIITNIELIQTNQHDALQKKITDPIYYTNFLSLAVGLAPDGANIKQVGLTVIRGGKPKSIALIKNKKKFLHYKKILAMR